MPPGFEEIQRQEVARLFGGMTRARLLLIPLFLSLFAWLVAVDRTPWRVWLLSLALPAFATFVVVEFLRYRRRGLAPGAVGLNLSFATGGIVLLSTASGGIESPFLPVLFLIATASALFASRRLSTWLFAIQLAGVWAFAAIAWFDLIPGISLTPFSSASAPASRRLWPTTLVLTVVLIVLRVATRAIRSAFDAMLARSIGAQQESLRTHAERAEELRALSGEIAHELKNPLASVKGLASLLTQHCPEGKGAERLGVLRREVDRMQATLEEFLNFSRPLVPLALAPTDVAALCREVAVLHEGMAQERGVTLGAPLESVRARCDARKVRQILINLVQNAIDASPRGGEVALLADEVGETILLQVLDRGRGVELGDEHFRPGVTSKEHGSGLGLTIARALARQHGGDLTLRPRDGGGTLAEVSLPANPAAAEGKP